MDLDQFWLNDAQIAEVAALEPSSPWGADLLRGVWHTRYPGDLSSESFRACAAVLSAICSGFVPGATVGAVQAHIETVNGAIDGSSRLDGDAAADARLTVTDAWGTASEHGFTAPQIAAAFESQLIYVARRFGEALRRERTE